MLLKEFKEIFAWSYQDMPRLDTEIGKVSGLVDPIIDKVGHLGLYKQK